MIIEEVQRMFSEKVTKNQLDRTKEQLKSNYIMSLESVANRMNSIGRNLLMLDRVLTADELIRKIDEITLESFYSLCDRVFQMDQMSLAMVGGLDEA